MDTFKKKTDFGPTLPAVSCVNMHAQIDTQIYTHKLRIRIHTWIQTYIPDRHVCIYIHMHTWYQIWGPEYELWGKHGRKLGKSLARSDIVSAKDECERHQQEVIEVTVTRDTARCSIYTKTCVVWVKVCVCGKFKRHRQQVFAIILSRNMSKYGLYANIAVVCRKVSKCDECERHWQESIEIGDAVTRDIAGCSAFRLCTKLTRVYYTDCELVCGYDVWFWRTYFARLRCIAVHVQQSRHTHAHVYHRASACIMKSIELEVRGRPSYKCIHTFQLCAYIHVCMCFEIYVRWLMRDQGLCIDKMTISEVTHAYMRMTIHAYMHINIHAYMYRYVHSNDMQACA